MKTHRTIPVLQKSHAPNKERIGFFQSFCSTTHASPSARFTVTLFVPTALFAHCPKRAKSKPNSRTKTPPVKRAPS
jgi:hypothetical protein